MSSGRRRLIHPRVVTPRAAILLLCAVLLGVPSALLRLSCSGATCAEAAPAPVPFCSLPEGLRAKIASGYLDGRSPEILAVMEDATVAGSVPAERASGSAGAGWPSVSEPPSTEVPIVFAGAGARVGASVRDGTGLRQIAPTIARIIGFERPFPEVRSGRPVPDVAASRTPRLVLQVVWRGMGEAELRADPDAWPTLRRLLSTGSGTLHGDVGSLPLDPAAALTTIGTGGTPSEHGITGGWLRDDGGHVVRAWSARAPTSVIATLAEDLDEELEQRPMIGLIGSDPSDRGIVGRGWYPENDRDAIRIRPGRRARLRAVDRVLAQGFGRDRVPDLLAIVSTGGVGALDDELRRIVDAARIASGGSVLIVVTATGSRDVSGAPRLEASQVTRMLEARIEMDARLVEVALPGGFFLDRGALAREGVTGADAVDALVGLTGADGAPLVADAFQGFAVSFGRYC